MKANLRSYAAAGGLCTLLLFPMAEHLRAGTDVGGGAMASLPMNLPFGRTTPEHLAAQTSPHQSAALSTVNWTLQRRPDFSSGRSVRLQTEYGSFEMDVSGATDAVLQTLKLASAGHCVMLQVESHGGHPRALRDGYIGHCD